MAKTSATTAVLTAICNIEEETDPQGTAGGPLAVAEGPPLAAAAATSTIVAAKIAPVERRSSSCDGRILVVTETSVVEKVQLESRPAIGARTRRASLMAGQAETIPVSTPRARRASTRAAQDLPTSTRKRTLSTSGQTEDCLLTASSTRKRIQSTSGQTEDGLLTASARKRRPSTRGRTDGLIPAGRPRRFASADTSSLLAGAREENDIQDDLVPLDEVAEELEAMSALVAETAGSICREVDPSSLQNNSSLPIDSCSKSISCSPTSSTSTSSTGSWLEDLYEAEWLAEQARVLTAASSLQLPAARSNSQLPPDQADAYLSAIKDFQKETVADNRERISADFMAEVMGAVEREGDGAQRVLLLEWARLAYACVFLSRRIQQKKKTMPEIIK
jgi:hypothetical protein